MHCWVLAESGHATSHCNKRAENTCIAKTSAVFSNDRLDRGQDGTAIRRRDHRRRPQRPHLRRLLARAGLKTLVLERRPVIGGAAVTEEVVPGFRFSVFSYLMSLLHPKVIAELELKHGYKVLPANDMFGPLPGGDFIVFSDDREDAAAFAGSRRRTRRSIRSSTATSWIRSRWSASSCSKRRRIRAAATGGHSGRPRVLWEYRKIGDKLFRLVDLMTMSADDYLSEWFESTHIKAVLAYYSGIGTFVGPKSPGSAYVIMHHVMGEHAGAGGWGFVEAAWARSPGDRAAGRAKGLEIRTDADVVAIDTRMAAPRASRLPTERASKRTRSRAMSAPS